MPSFRLLAVIPRFASLVGWNGPIGCWRSRQRWQDVEETRWPWSLRGVLSCCALVSLRYGRSCQPVTVSFIAAHATQSQICHFYFDFCVSGAAATAQRFILAAQELKTHIKQSPSDAHKLKLQQQHIRCSRLLAQRFQTDRRRMNDGHHSDEGSGSGHAPTRWRRVLTRHLPPLRLPTPPIVLPMPQQHNHTRPERSDDTGCSHAGAGGRCSVWLPRITTSAFDDAFPQNLQPAQVDIFWLGNTQSRGQPWESRANHNVIQFNDQRKGRTRRTARVA
ncbi:hypothetical protein C8F01DRAFT_1095935 [Mycena amicta]|nr:hypothetical protein C8F01DRAFT_1095935 [Mycena amicta]